MKVRALPLLLCLIAPSVLAEEVWLSDPTVTNFRQAENEHARPGLDRSSRGAPLKVGKREYAKGLGTQVDNRLAIEVNGATKFTALAGVDDATNSNLPLRFEIIVDGQSLWRRELKKGDAPVPVEIDLRGKKLLMLVNTDVGNGYTEGHANWLEAKFEVEGTKPKTTPVAPVAEAPYILTPKPAATPRINSAPVFGARPGNPFLFTLAATGDRPMTFSADGLPEGLTLDGATGRISGSVVRPGTHQVTIRATNARGTAEQKLRIEIGEKISLTPPLGWNSWNCFGPEVDAAKVRGAAKAMVSTGLIHHGWTYINIDDAWQAPVRGGPHHAIQPNEKFPDIKALVDEIHGLSLKAGIYSTPWETSYAGYIGGSSDHADGAWSKEGSRRRRHHGHKSFAENDARQWAEWGFDYLKYDWNPKSTNPPETAGQFHYYVAAMAHALRHSGRDMLYSYSNSMPFEWIAEQAPLLNAWRTTGDIHDAWGYIVRIGFSQNRWRPFAGPGRWNDPDMLVVGYVSVGSGKNLHPTYLTPNEQYTHITLWSLLSSPLLIGCDMERLDEFTLNLLTNDEVIAVNQDELGRQAAQTIVDGRKQVWVKELADGSRAIGLFNLAQEPQEISVSWDKVGLKGAQNVRDVWRQQDLGAQSEKFSVTVPRHGAYLIRVSPAK